MIANVIRVMVRRNDGQNNKYRLSLIHISTAGSRTGRATQGWRLPPDICIAVSVSYTHLPPQKWVVALFFAQAPRLLL